VRAAVIDALLALALLHVWLGCLGFARLHSALERLHCVTFVNAGAGLAIVAAAFVSDGLSDRALKILLLAAVQLIVGTALSHATVRALFLREPVKDSGR
jgi:multicomponent Na+:H+ antiporter subunit G